MIEVAPKQDVLFELTAVGVVETDVATGHLLRANETFCTMVGYSEAELQSMTYLELTYPDDRERDAGGFAVFARAGRSLTRLLREDGSALWLELHTSIVGEGPGGRNLTVAVDVTERERRAAASTAAAHRHTDEQIHRAIQETLNDTNWFRREVMARVAYAKTGNAGAYRPVALTKREREVLGLVAWGLNNDAIAREFGLTRQTARNYVSELYGKIRVNSRAEAVVWARERGLGG